MADQTVTDFLLVVSVAEALLCTAVALALLRRWSRHGSGATGSALGLFLVVTSVVVASLAPPDDVEHGWGLVWSKALVCVLLAMPYLLVRFSWALGALSDAWNRACLVLLGVQVLVTAVIPPLPAPESTAPAPGWANAYVAFILIAWTGQSVLAAVSLWRVGQGQSSVVRHRMRSLSTGGVLLAATLVASSAAGGEHAAAPLRIGVALLGLLSLGLFALAFLPPASLRVLWRQSDLAVLAGAERGLMTALTRDDVADTIVPVLGAVFGGGGAALYDEGRVPLRVTGLAEGQAEELAHVLERDGSGPQVRQATEEVLTAQLGRGWLLVQAGRLAPVFGDDEAVLLGRVATLVDLALQRVVLFEAERSSRAAAEAANDELETLLYSVSHDLRSPLISVLGYLDFLQREASDQLVGDGAHYVDRILVNALYMQSLITDLLELSRVGRSDPPAQRLPLAEVAEQVVHAARLGHPAATVVDVGTFPVVRMSDVRARQLLTNLVDNALKHGGRDDITVTVQAGTTATGELELIVTDDGCGIPVEYRERVLKVFERLDAPRSSPGTGMGLAICKRIAETLGGTLTVEGPAAGAVSGTTVRATLPASLVTSGRPPLVGGDAVPAQRERMADSRTSTPSEERT